MTSTTPVKTTRDPTVALLNQLSLGPSFREVAAVLLREQLQVRYPNVDIDPGIAMIGTPQRDIIGDRIVTQAVEYQTLAGILARQAVLAIPALYIEGEHFLTQQPITEPPVHLPVRVDEIASIINHLAPVMLRGYQALQLEFWNQPNGQTGPHWRGLSNILRDAWNVDTVPGWSHDDCVMARKLFRAADLKDRRLNDSHDTHAYVLDIDEVGDDDTKTHVIDTIVAVLIGKQNGSEVVLTYSPLQGYDRYTSREQFGQAVPALLAASVERRKLQWRLFEPEGNFFDWQACELISMQIEAIGTLDFSDIRGTQAPLPTRPRGETTGESPNMAWLEQALPDWLQKASAADLDAYSRHLKDLSALHSLNAGKSYQDGIATIEQFALDKLKTEMLYDGHTNAVSLALDTYEIEVRSQVIWGTFTVPGQVETTTFSLAQLALQNLIALPLGNKILRQRNGRTIPDWLTVSYVEELITRIDIGSTYPALVKSTLLGDQQESARRQQLYASHLRIQLPLLALQLKIRNEAGLDERGYRYVAAVMAREENDRQVEGQAIVIRPLAFVPKRRTDASMDVVANMFVIGPRDMSAGPCLLYRPLLDQPLAQYPSPANLLYSIQQSASLRDSVLAWLPDDAGDDYARYVFPGTLPSPWAVVEFLVDPTKLLTLSGPMSLGEGTLTGDPFEALFKANANALVTLADRQSVSNAEARWATLKHAGWLIFNAALPFLGRTVGAGAWIWQLMDQLQALVEAQDHADTQATWERLADLLMNLGLAMALHSLTHSTSRGPAEKKTEPEQVSPPEAIPPKAPPVASKVADIRDGRWPLDHARSLHTSGALNQAPTRLGAVLDRFKLSKPADLGEPISEAGPYRHLYPADGKYYAPVGTRWFEVKVDDNDSVIIVDPHQPQRTGPPLVANRQGNWFVDTRLRLRGGGPKSLARKAQTLAQQRAETLRKQLSEFEKAKKNAQGNLQKARKQMDEAASTSAQARRQDYLQALESQRQDYETALQRLKELHVHAPTPDYAPRAIGYVKAQLDLEAASLREAQTQFHPVFEDVLKHIRQEPASPQERQIETAQKMTDLSPRIIQHLDYINTRFSQLRTLSIEGLELIKATKRLLPAYTSDMLKALNITVARDLCLEPRTVATAPLAWAAIDSIVDRAVLAIQCLQDTLLERSESRLDERIDSLISLIEQFKLIDERLQDFPEEFSDEALAEPIQRLRQQIEEFHKQGSHNLALLTTERSMARTRATPPPTPPRPKKMFINTRYNGVLIGEQRLTPIGLETDLVDIRSPLTEKIVATFHEKTPGVWVERTPPASPPTPPVDLQISINAGQTLIDQLPAFELRATAQANKPSRTAMGVEEMFHQHARRLEQVSADIDEALTASNATESNMLSAATVNRTLNEQVQRLYQQAKEHRLRISKLSPPTMTALEWLVRNEQLTIKKTVNRRRIKSKTPDFLDEYTISERGSRHVLWYAHFHYSADWTPNRSFLSARLKTVAQQRLGAAADSVKGLDETQRVAFYSSEISLAQAQRVFFP